MENNFQSNIFLLNQQEPAKKQQEQPANNILLQEIIKQQKTQTTSTISSQEITNHQQSNYSVKSQISTPETIKTEKGTFTKINDDQLVENLGNLTISELLQIKLQEIETEPSQKKLFDILTKDQKEQYLIEAVVTSYTKIHNLKNPYDEKKAETKTEGAAKHLANNSQGEAKINSELGIIQQNNNIDQYKIIEEKNDGTIQVRNTSTIDSTIPNNEPTNNQQAQSPNQNYQSSQNNNYELSQTEINPYYQKPTELNKKQDHILKRTLKPNDYYSNDRAAFIDLKMIIALLSSSLFIGWVIGKIIAYL